MNGVILIICGNNSSTSETWFTPPKVSGFVVIAHSRGFSKEYREKPKTEHAFASHWLITVVIPGSDLDYKQYFIQSCSFIATFLKYFGGCKYLFTVCKGYHILSPITLPKVKKDKESIF